MKRDGNADLTVAVLAAEQRWVQAHLDMDLETIAALLSDDYRQLQPDGTTIGKQELLASYGSGERYWEIAASSDHDIQVIGNVAIMLARWRGKGINAGEPFDYRAPFLCIYVLEAGEWKLYLDASMPPTDSRSGCVV
jgi:ketosteroid isomerase-like protein